MDRNPTSRISNDRIHNQCVSNAVKCTLIGCVAMENGGATMLIAYVRVSPQSSKDSVVQALTDVIFSA
jgi:hypothetical protein